MGKRRPSLCSILQKNLTQCATISLIHRGFSRRVFNSTDFNTKNTSFIFQTVRAKIYRRRFPVKMFFLSAKERNVPAGPNVFLIKDDLMKRWLNSLRFLNQPSFPTKLNIQAGMEMSCWPNLKPFSFSIFILRTINFSHSALHCHLRDSIKMFSMSKPSLRG